MPDTGRYQQPAYVMVCRHASTGTLTFYPDPTKDRGTSPTAADSIFTQEGSSVLRPDHHGLLLGVYSASGDVYHSTQVDSYQEWRVLDDDDNPYIQGNFRVTKVSNLAFRNDLNATTGSAEGRSDGNEELWIPMRNGMRVEIDKAADSGVLLLHVLYVVKK